MDQETEKKELIMQKEKSQKEKDQIDINKELDMLEKQLADLTIPDS